MTGGKVSASRLAVIAIALLCALAIMSSTFPVYPPVPYGGFLSIGLGQVAAQSVGNWVINGTAVYSDDDKAFLSATPHTLESSGWVEFELLSKKWSGDVDVVWGFPADLGVKPKDLQRWALNVSHERTRWVTVEERYTLDVCNISAWKALQWDGTEPDWGNRNNEFIYSITASDWGCTGNSTNATSYVIAFNSYEGNKEHATFYGNRDVQREEVYYEYYDDWVAWNSPSVTSVDYGYAGVDEWHVVRLDKSIVAGKTYKVRAWIDVPVKLGRYTYKYVWAVKPQSETIQEAKANGHLYLLDPWLSGGWSKRIKLTSNCTKVDSDLTHFPITVFLKTGNGDTTKVFDEVGSSYLKIAIADNSATPVQYYVEVEKWDSTNKVGVLHFGKSGEVLPSSANKDYYLYYDSTHADNTGYVGLIDSTPGAAVWDSYFRAVHHMVDATTSTIKDSTSNNVDGTKKAANEPIQVDGKVAKAQDYDGTNDYIDLANGAINPGTNSITIESFFRLDGHDGGAQDLIRCYGTDSDNSVCIERYTDNKLFALFRDGSTNAAQPTTSTTYVAGSTIYYIVATWDTSTKTAKIYIDLVEKASATNTNVGTINTDGVQCVGAWKNPNDGTHATYWDGLIDELRFSYTLRSAAWIKATYNSLNDSLLTYGSEERPTEITNTPTSRDFGTLAVGATGATSINYFTVTNTGGCAVDVTIQGTDLSGGDDTWDLADDGSPGENIYGLYAGLDDTDDTFDVTVREATPYNTLVSGLAVNATQSWGLKIYMPTSVPNYDGQQMSGTVTLVASAAS